MHNMMKVGAAVRELRKANNLTLEELANDVGYDQGNLSKFERGLQTTDDEMIERLAKRLNTSKAALLRRAAELEEQESPPLVAEEPTASYAARAVTRLPRVNQVPVFDDSHLQQIAGGQPVEASEDMPTIPGSPDTRPGDFAWRVTDDAMTGPPGSVQSYPLGCMAYMDPTLEHRSGDAVLALIGGQVAFTSLQNVNGTWMMVPLNPRYPAKELPYNSRVLAVAYGMYCITRQR